VRALSDRVVEFHAWESANQTAVEWSVDLARIEAMRECGTIFMGSGMTVMATPKDRERVLSAWRDYLMYRTEVQ
jgi:hypothetical protein